MQHASVNTSNESRSQKNVIESVEITHKADLEWIWSQKRHGIAYAVWRYIGLVFGVFRFYPTIKIPKLFNVKHTEWYQRAIVAPDKVTVSPPALDPTGAGFLITFSKALRANMTVPGHPSRKRTLGVMAIAVTVEYLATMLKKTYDLCKQEGFICFIIDESGFIIVHRHFVTPPTNSKKIPWIENVHIANKEPEIAMDLIRKKYMTNTSCVDLETQSQRTIFKIMENVTTVDNMNNEPTYYMERVVGTNLFLVLRTASLVVPQPCLCLDPYSSSTSECDDNTHVDCKCPCYTQRDDKAFCEDKSSFRFVSDWTACTPLRRSDDAELTALMEDESPHLRMLLTCFEYRCEVRMNETDCHRFVGCRWCHADKEGYLLDKSFCTNYDECYYGRKRYKGPYREHQNDFLLTNIVLASIVSMLVVTAGLVAYCQNKIEAKRRTSLEELATKLRYTHGHHHRGPYTKTELKQWQRRKKRLERAARRKQGLETRLAERRDSESSVESIQNVKDMMISRFPGGLPTKEQCKQQ